jgi:hypothetical protein
VSEGVWAGAILLLPGSTVCDQPQNPRQLHPQQRNTHAHLVLDLCHGALGAPVHVRGQLRGVERAVRKALDALAAGEGAPEAGAAKAVALLELVVAEVGEGVEADLHAWSVCSARMEMHASVLCR